MTDKTIPAALPPEDVEYARSYVRDFLDSMHTNDRTLAVARVLDALLPPPKRPTLADMTSEERDGCERMQCDVEHRGRAVVIVPEWGAGHAILLDRWGSVFYAAHDTITPRPDLPRLEWPGDQKAAPAAALPRWWRLADHKDDGRVVVTNPTPGHDGRVYYVVPNAVDDMGYDWLWCDPDELTYLDQEADQ